MGPSSSAHSSSTAETRRKGEGGHRHQNRVQAESVGHLLLVVVVLHQADDDHEAYQDLEHLEHARGRPDVARVIRHDCLELAWRSGKLLGEARLLVLATAWCSRRQRGSPQAHCTFGGSGTSTVGAGLSTETTCRHRRIAFRRSRRRRTRRRSS
ncbi:hypothetical protein MTO96_014952 [Rhipicephalus appendiculatus]